MAANANDYFQYVGEPGSATTLSAPGYTAGATSITVGATTNWPTTTGVTFAIDEVELVNGEYQRVDGTYNVYRGTVASGTGITNMVWAKGDGDRDYAAGATTRVYITVASEWAEQLVTGLLVSHEQDGSLKDDIVTAPKVSGIDKSNLTTDTNPYRFSAYRNAAWTTPNTTFGKVTCDTEHFDPNNNFASGTYTAPVTGLYHFQGSAAETATTNGLIRVATIYVNGAEARRGTEFAATGTINTTAHVSAFISLTAGDTVELYTYGNNKAGGTGQVLTWFSGYLVSRA